LLRWFEPELFAQWELRAAGTGAIEVPIDENVTAEQVEVTAEDGTLLPATVSGGTLRFFAGSPGVVRVAAGDRMLVFSVTLPDVPTEVWEPPGEAAQGVPPAMAATASSYSLWRWLVLAALVVLLVEWLVYGRRKTHLGRRGRRLPLTGWFRARSERLLRRAS
ncbi:MAG: hypothetical protein GY953_51565, partial [bacterium]|nr:hypothetical protein [bacterium]